MKTNQVDLEDNIHKQMKDLAWKKKMTIKSFIVAAIKEKLKKEKNQ